jgi:hypothetical protein
MQAGGDAKFRVDVVQKKSCVGMGKMRMLRACLQRQQQMINLTPGPVLHGSNYSILAQIIGHVRIFMRIMPADGRQLNDIYPIA